MKPFATLLEKLILTPSRNRKIDYLANYFASTPDPDRGFALAAITRDLSLKNLKANTLKQITMEHVDPVLFELSYDYVGDMAETISLIWPEQDEQEQSTKLPTLTQLIADIEKTPKAQLPSYITQLLNIATPAERWAMIKLITGGLRIGVSARLAKTALSAYSGKDLSEIEKIWHGLEIPYTDLFAWLDNKSPKPQINHAQTFHPIMLANPIDEEKDFAILKPDDFIAEWKWDGIRVQLVFDKDNVHKKSARMFSRTGDDISHTFPDITTSLNGSAVLDGELLVGHNFEPLPFNCLQQRLNRKTVVQKHLKEYPAYISVYDILFDGDEDIRDLPLIERRKRLEAWFAQNVNSRLTMSDLLTFSSWEELGQIRRQGADDFGHEGIMLKRKTSLYEAGRPKGPWFKWKRDPKLVDAILMYAQRGHGKRSSFYSDYTFGVWKNNDIVPIGKAYSGFTDEELKTLDKWVRANTVNKFGPVREVKKEVVLEIAFDSAQESPRHKSGVALRFPRINRIRWDKPMDEVETLEAFREQHLSEIS